MTYDEAQCIIDDKTQNTSIANSLRNLNRLAKILKKRRIDSGLVRELRVFLDGERGRKA